MPLGGSFALDIFRQDAKRATEMLRTQLETVNTGAPYNVWLGERSRIWNFGKREASDLLELTIENKKGEILCDAVVVVGYGFNDDDRPINGIFRSLVERGVRLIIFEHDSSGELAGDARRRGLGKLRLRDGDGVKWWPVDNARRSGDGMWWERVAEIV